MLVVVCGKPLPTRLVDEDANLRHIGRGFRLPPTSTNFGKTDMTVDEFIGKIDKLKQHYRDLGDYSITVHKQDKNQLSCFTTVPVESCNVGFDWTMNQLVLEPSVKLTTHPDETRDAMIWKLNQYSKDLTRHMSLAATLARMLKDIPDEEVRNRLSRMKKSGTGSTKC